MKCDKVTKGDKSDKRGRVTKGDVHYLSTFDKRGRTLFVNFWLENKRTSDTIQMRGDSLGTGQFWHIFNFCQHNRQNQLEERYK